MTATLYRDGHVRSPDHPAATALLVRGGAIAWVGDDPDLPSPTRPTRWSTWPEHS